VAFQFGSHALTRANTNKRIELELRAIGPFLADVDDEEAVKKAKIAFMGRMFGRAWDENRSAESGAPADSLTPAMIAKIADEIVRIRAAN
jgi:hypothetical protein